MSEASGLAGWAVEVMEQLGPAGAGAMIALENLFPPIPSEAILPLAGFTASQGDFSVWSAIAWTTIGSVVGASILYGIGAAVGRDRTFRIWQWLPLVKDADFLRTEEWFARHGRRAVLFGRMLPIFRSLISVPAGLERMSIGIFLLLTTAGSLIWNTTFVVLGYQLGEQWHRVEPVVGYLQWAVLAAAGFGLAWFVITRIRERRLGA